MTSSDLVVAQMRKAELMAASDILPPAYRKHPANLLVAMEAAEALGVTLFQAIQMITVINGRMTMSAEGMRALVLGKGHMILIEEETADVCRLAVARKERPGDVQRFMFTIKDAQRAGLTGGNYAKYPGPMLLARCTTKACRAVFPDVIAGISYTPDEVADWGTAPTFTATPDSTQQGVAAPAGATDNPVIATPAGEPLADAAQLTAFPAGIVDAEIVEDETYGNTADRRPQDQP